MATHMPRSLKSISHQIASIEHDERYDCWRIRYWFVHEDSILEEREVPQNDTIASYVAVISEYRNEHRESKL